MTNKATLGIYIGIGLTVAFLAGRFSTPEKVKIEKVEVVKLVEREDLKEAIKKDETKEITTEVIEKKDGTRITRTKTRIVNKDETKTYKSKSKDSSSEKKHSKLVENRARNRITLLKFAPESLRDFREVNRNFGIMYQHEFFLNIHGVIGAKINKFEPFIGVGISF